METDNIQIARIIILMENLDKKVDAVGLKVDNIKDEFIVETVKELAVQKEKISRLEWIVYGSLSVIFVQTVALLLLYFKHAA